MVSDLFKNGGLGITEIVKNGIYRVDGFTDYIYLVDPTLAVIEMTATAILSALAAGKVAVFLYQKIKEWYDARMILRRYNGGRESQKLSMRLKLAEDLMKTLAEVGDKPVSPELAGRIKDFFKEEAMSAENYLDWSKDLKASLNKLGVRSYRPASKNILFDMLDILPTAGWHVDKVNDAAAFIYNGSHTMVAMSPAALEVMLAATNILAALTAFNTFLTAGKIAKMIYTWLKWRYKMFSYVRSNTDQKAVARAEYAEKLAKTLERMGDASIPSDLAEDISKFFTEEEQNAADFINLAKDVEKVAATIDSSKSVGSTKQIDIALMGLLALMLLLQKTHALDKLQDVLVKIGAKIKDIIQDLIDSRNNKRARQANEAMDEVEKLLDSIIGTRREGYRDLDGMDPKTKRELSQRMDKLTDLVKDIATGLKNEPAPKEPFSPYARSLNYEVYSNSPLA